MLKKFICALLLICSVAYADGPGTPLIEADQPKRGLLIFLDDSEDYFGAITADFLSAFAKNAGPILVSASLLANCHSAPKPKIENPAEPEALYWAFFRAGRRKDDQEGRNILVDQINFDQSITKNWTIKEINPSLYLLLPKKYLQEQHIMNAQIAEDAAVSITPTEQKLGLKVNHMRTVYNLAEIVKPMPEPRFADYFIQALKQGNVFVSKKEYYAQQNRTIPVWSIYIEGHGSKDRMITYLSLEQFKEFLDILETKIITRFVMYDSCYAAGTNLRAVYEDAKNNIDKAYSFAIIMGVLTDSPTSVLIPKIERADGKSILQIRLDHASFLKEIIEPTIDYEKAIKVLKAGQAYSPTLDKATYIRIYGAEQGEKKFLEELQKGASIDVSNIAQIKYPGLPWFSVLHKESVAPISSILAKTQSKPLDIAKHFKIKKGILAEPYAILLHEHQIPFEIKVDTKVDQSIGYMSRLSGGHRRLKGDWYVPTFISMLPGNAVHYLQKISSEHSTASDILDSFYLDGLAPRKIFMIKSIEAPFSDSLQALLGAQRGILHDVVIESTKEHYRKYFMYSGVLYGATDKDPITRVNAADKNNYTMLLQHSKPISSEPLTATQVADWTVKTENQFAQMASLEQAELDIKKLLVDLPDNIAVHIPKMHIGKRIAFVFGSLDFLKFAKNLSQYSIINARKIIWIDEVKGTGDFVGPYKNVIIDVGSKGTKVFYSQGTNLFDATDAGWRALEEDYMPRYRAAFDYFAQHNTLEGFSGSAVGARVRPGVEKKMVGKLLSPQAIATIKAAQAKKVTDVVGRPIEQEELDARNRYAQAAEKTQLLAQQEQLLAQLKKTKVPAQKKKLQAKLKQIDDRLKSINLPSVQQPIQPQPAQPKKQPAKPKKQSAAQQKKKAAQKKALAQQQKKLVAQQKKIAAQLKKAKTPAQKKKLQAQLKKVNSRLKQIKSKMR